VWDFSTSNPISGQTYYDVAHCQCSRHSPSQNQEEDRIRNEKCWIPQQFTP
jgi:hypothetical protein